MQLNSCHGEREACKTTCQQEAVWDRFARALVASLVALQPSPGAPQPAPEPKTRPHSRFPCHPASTRRLCTPDIRARLQQKMKLFLVILSVGLVSIIIANNLDKLDPCILSCMVKLLQVFGCKGNDDEIVLCGCKIIDRYEIVGEIAGCTEKACNISLADFPEALKDTQKCSDTFGSPTGSPDMTFPRYIPTVGIFTSSSLSSGTVSSTPSPPSDGISWTSTPTSTPPPGSADSPPRGTPIRTSSGALIHTLVSSMTSNAPIGSQTGGLTTTPTASPAPPSDGPELSPAVIATIVVSTVTVIGVPLWLLRCYRGRKSRATSSVEGNTPPVPAEKRIESVVTGYNELLGSTEMRHEMLSNTPPNDALPLYINTIAEIDSEPLRKTPEVSPEEESPEDAISQAVSFSATTAVSCPEPQQAAKEEEETNTEVPEDAPRVEEDTETELEVLQKRQRELERKRHYLQQIQEIDEEEARLQQRIDELQRQSQPPER